MIGIASRTTGWANPGRRRRRTTIASVAPRAARTPAGSQSSRAGPDSGLWRSRIVAPDIGCSARSAGRGSAGASDARRSSATTACPPPTSAADADRGPLGARTAFGAAEARRAGSRAACARADRVRPAAPAAWTDGEPTGPAFEARAAVGTLWIGTVRRRVTDPPTEARGGRPATVTPDGRSASVRACTGTSASAGSGAGDVSAVGAGFTGTGSACAAASGAFAASGAGDGVTGGAGAAAAGAAVVFGFGAAAGVGGVGEGA
jgi:hypothetical protein